MKKLTLSADPEVIALAHRLAQESGTSVSSMFERFIRLLASRQEQRVLGPLTKKASGIVRLPQGKSDTQLLEEALLEKYGLE